MLMPSELINRIPIKSSFLDFEWRFRHAQATTTLDALRRHLLLRDQMYQSKDRFVRGQRSNTRSQTILKRMQATVDADVQKYRFVYKRLEALAVPLKKKEDDWAKVIQVLADGDIQGFGKRKDEDPEASHKKNTEGRRTLSWIWKTPGTANRVDMAHESKHRDSNM